MCIYIYKITGVSNERTSEMIYYESETNKYRLYNHTQIIKIKSYIKVM